MKRFKKKLCRGFRVRVGEGVWVIGGGERVRVIAATASTKNNETLILFSKSFVGHRLKSFVSKLLKALFIVAKACGKKMKLFELFTCLIG